MAFTLCILHFAWVAARNSQRAKSKISKLNRLFTLFVVAAAAVGTGGSGCYENNHKYKVALIY